MFEKHLPRATHAVLRNIASAIEPFHFYLAGGSGLSLQLRHRISEDLDFFTEDRFDEDHLLNLLREASDSCDNVIVRKHTLICTLDTVRCSFFQYDIPLVYPQRKTLGIKVADWRDILAEKFKTLSQRGSKKDFYDIYASLKTKKISIPTACTILRRRFENTGLNLFHILKSLVYFEDAEGEPDPVLLKGNYHWEDVKKFFRDNITEFEKHILHRP